MAVLTLRSVPTDVYDQLRARASDQRRSINSEAIECLRYALARRSQRNVTAFLARARATRDSLAAAGVALGANELAEARREGRA